MFRSAPIADWRSFASPHEPRDRALFGMVAGLHGRLVCQAFLERFGSRLRETSDGLAETLVAWLDKEASFEEVWNLGFGRIRAALRPGQEAGAVQAAVRFAFDLHAQGVPGRWSARLLRPAVFHWGVLEFTASSLAVETDGEAARLYADRRSRLVQRRRRGIWEAANLAVLPTVAFGSTTVMMLLGNTLSCSSFDDIRLRLAKLDTRDIEAALYDAAALLGEEAPVYAVWVADMLRSVIPLARPLDGPYFSGSYADRPGAVTCSLPASPVMIGELLVHEVSHHYFYLMQHLGPLHDVADKQLYWSPVREMGRPLIYILLAYHAVANMLLYHREAALHGGRTAAKHRERDAALTLWLPDLERPFRREGALTSLGLSLWQPLEARLHA